MKYRLVLKSLIALCMALCICGGSRLGMISSTADSEDSVEAIPQAQPLADTETEYKDGVYIGKGTGFKGTITATVTIQSGKIADIKLENEADDEPFFTNASALVDSVLTAQSADVDVISGATYSSKGILQAIRNALALASGQETETLEAASGSSTASSGKVSVGSSSIDEANAVYRDGTYTGTGQGFKSTITATVTIKGGKIASIQLSGGDDASYWNKAKSLANTIVSKQSTNVDVVSGSSYSSCGIIQAVRNALSKAIVSGSSDDDNPIELPENNNSTPSKPSPLPPADEENTLYNDGTYTGSGKGFKGTITATVTIRNGKIAEIELENEADDEPFFTNASALTDTIIQAQNTEVDVVSGATYSSKGILEAVDNALAQALSEEEILGYPDGLYTGEAIISEGFDKNAGYQRYTVTAVVCIENGKIHSVSVTTDDDVQNNGRNKRWIAMACDSVPSQPVGLTDLGEWEYEAVSGATYSSDAIRDAIQNALSAVTNGGESE